MNRLFETSWRRAWTGLGADGDGAAVRAALLGRYAEPHRSYHTQQHLHECLSRFEGVVSWADHPHEVEIALWFHDAIYELNAADNELRSADWARRELLRAGINPACADRVHALVMATQHRAPPTGRDAQLLVDVDLSILGAPAHRFAEYERQIRQEYTQVPAPQFRARRRGILQSFLDRPVIYSTTPIHDELESRARDNLVAALAAVAD